MTRPHAGNFKISILNINVQTITFNGSLNIGKTLIVKKKEKKKKGGGEDQQEDSS
ncbi:MAG TPA: hypothetical protein VFK37_07690 [Bacillales bacterium]|nr:hypothetical protein [Bacillales bacterium]